MLGRQSGRETRKEERRAGRKFARYSGRWGSVVFEITVNKLSQKLLKQIKGIAHAFGSMGT